MKDERPGEFQVDIIEFLHHPFCVVDADDYTVKMANSAARLSGLTGSSTCYGIAHGRSAPCDGSEHPCPLEIVKRTGKPVTVEHIHYDRDGNARNLEVHAHPIFDRRGNVIQIIEYCLDITERKQTEKALQENEKRLRNLVEALPMGLHMYQLGADGQLRFAGANPAADKILGVENTQYIGQTIDEAFPNIVETEIPGKFRTIAEEGGFWHKEEIIYEDERIKGAFESFNFQVSPGQVASLFNEITERKRAEQALLDEVKTRYNYEEIAGKSPALQNVLRQVELVAPSDTPVLVLGETGTGKELICRAIHHLSARNTMPLIKLNCATIPPGLVESELFGHERGAFTGAISRKQGRFELAHGGTIFLDEIGDLPLETQAKLLRVLEDQAFERVGGTRTVKVDTRVIAATHRDLEQMVRDGCFREDLFYRLNVFPVTIPPLRKRKEDISLLAHYFVRRACARLGRPPCGINDRALQRLLAYPWPGNVRELENIIDRAVILCGGGTIDRQHVQVEVGAPSAARGQIPSLQEVERGHILVALRAASWKVSGKGGAAELLGLKPTTLQSRMQKLGIRRGAS